ncbi:MAG: Molybdopterin oxidoreductase [Dehalococcoidia bacterium]|nr:Molybdopterin oxidoreductase [Dehalococcoidia bacterium]
MRPEVIRTNCGMCHGGCGVLAHVTGGKLVKVEGDPDCPASRGALCPQGLSATQYVYHPDRLKHPMKRVGQRGEGKWERISWEEALATIAGKLSEVREKYGPLGLAVCGGTGRPVSSQLRRFSNIWGTPNSLGTAHNCMYPTVATNHITYGNNHSADMENSSCIVNWTFKLPAHQGTGRKALNFIRGLKKGAKVISVDPYLSPLAAKSDIWLQIRPGTDCAMALAWLNEIIKGRLYDREFVDKWTFGFDRLAEHVERFTPEWAEQVTWVPAASIRQAARLYASSRPASIHSRVAWEFGTNSTNTGRSIYFLPAVTGNIDTPGGNIFWEEPLSPQQRLGVAMKPEDWSKAVGNFPLINRVRPVARHAGFRAMLTGEPYPIKALMVHASNPIVTGENPRGLIYEAMMKLDFISVMDVFMTPTAELADIVLPASTPFERDNLHVPSGPDSYVPPTLCAAPKVIEPLWEARHDVEVFIEVLKRVGLSYGAECVDEYLDVSLKPIGLNFAQLKEMGWVSRPQEWKKYERGLLRPDNKPGFNTPSGKVEFYSRELEKLKLDPLPVHKEPPESPVSTPELLESYPLVLTTGIRSPVFFHTQYRQLPWTREIHSEPRVRINTETAAKFGIENNDWVWIESPRGRCRQRALLTTGMDPRVVLAEHGWWFPESPGAEHGAWEANINLLTDSEHHDPGLGSTPMRSLLCRVYKA